MLHHDRSALHHSPDLIDHDLDINERVAFNSKAVPPDAISPARFPGAKLIEATRPDKWNLHSKGKSWKPS